MAQSEQQIEKQENLTDLLVQGKYFKKRNDWNKAIEIYQKILKKGANYQAFKCLAHIYELNNDKINAEQNYTQAIELLKSGDQKVPNIEKRLKKMIYKRNYVRYSQRKWDQAISDLQDLLIIEQSEQQRESIQQEIAKIQSKILKQFSKEDNQAKKLINYCTKKDLKREDK